MIPYKEYVARKATEVKALTTSKPTLEDEENWDEGLPLPSMKLPQALNLCCNLRKRSES